jgi:uncharacterized protein YceK
MGLLLMLLEIPGCISILAHSESNLSPGEIIPKEISETEIVARSDREWHSRLFCGIRSDGEILTASNYTDIAQVAFVLVATVDFPFTCVADLIYAPFDVADDMNYQRAHASYLAALKKMQEANQKSPASAPTPVQQIPLSPR